MSDCDQRLSRMESRIDRLEERQAEESRYLQRVTNDLKDDLRLLSAEVKGLRETVAGLRDTVSDALKPGRVLAYGTLAGLGALVIQQFIH